MYACKHSYNSDSGWLVKRLTPSIAMHIHTYTHIHMPMHTNKEKNVNQHAAIHLYSSMYVCVCVFEFTRNRGNQLVAYCLYFTCVYIYEHTHT